MPMPEPRKTFGPVVLVGLGSAALAAVAGTKPWLASEVGASQLGGETLAQQIGLDVDAPLAGALSLVLLAAWGVLLVTRGRVRQMVAGLAGLASVAVLGIAVSARFTMRDDLRARFTDNNLADAYDGSHFTGWWYAALAGSAIAVFAAAAAVRFVRHWPEMGSRYDAPGAGEAVRPAPAERSHLDLWKSMDEGHDPTA